MTPDQAMVGIEIAAIVISLSLGLISTVLWRRLGRPWRFCVSRAWSMFAGIPALAVAIVVGGWLAVALMFVWMGIQLAGAIQASRRVRRAELRVSALAAEERYRERCRRWQYRAWHLKTPNLN